MGLLQIQKYLKNYLITENMEKNNVFNIARSGHLLVRQLGFSTNGLMIGFGAVTGILIFILSMTIIFGHVNMSSNIFYGTIMPYFFIMGYIFTSNIYSELRHPQRGYQYLILPASTLEKLMIPWLISSILYVLTSIIALFIINTILIICSGLIGGNHVPLFNPFALDVLKMFAVYMVTQPIFVLGAIYFRKNNFLKTILALFLIGFIIVLYVGISASLIINHDLHGMNFGNNDIPDNVQFFFVNKFTPVVKVIFWGFLAPFFLLISYFRLKEREV